MKVIMKVTTKVRHKRVPYVCVSAFRPPSLKSSAKGVAKDVELCIILLVYHLITGDET
jgi:hypothetical protein